MIFEVENYYIDLIRSDDIEKVVEVYNSNERFLMNHIGCSLISSEWLLDEIECMKHNEFKSYKIVEKGNGKIIGIIDARIGTETYLSLLVLHKDYQKYKLGAMIYKAFESYIKTINCKYIRSDVVTDYDINVENFWIKNGYKKTENIILDWNGNKLQAVTMKKELV